jgi:hypothetical protein
VLEDVTTKSGLKDEWDVLRSNVAQITKRKQWLGNKEKTVSELALRMRIRPKDHQSRIRETMAKKGP